MNIKDVFAKAENGTLTYEQFEELCKGFEVAPKFTDLSEGKYVGKSKYDDDLGKKDLEINGLNQTIATRDTDLASLQEKLAQAGSDTEALTKLQSEMATLKTTYEQQTNELNAKLQKQSYEYAVRDFANSKQFSSEAAKRDFVSQLNSQNLQVVDGKIFGGEDFARQYAEANKDAFIAEKPVVKEPVPTFVQPTQQQNVQKDNGFNFNFMGVRSHS